MKLSDIEYPQRLCFEMLHYCFWSNKKTENMTPDEIREALKTFFTDEEIQESVSILTGLPK